GEPRRIERAHGLDNLCRTATRVFVQMQPKAFAEIRNTLDRCHFRISIDRACPSKPSARASVVTVFAIPLRPRRVMRCTDTSLTKSAAFKPPRNRAAPAVGRTWLEPIA